MAVHDVLQGVVPSTPRGRKAAEINQLINSTIDQLNLEYPQLLLRKRTSLESPSSRPKSPNELCYDRLLLCCYTQREKLEPSLISFRLQAKDAPPHVSLATLLIECLPAIGSPAKAKTNPTPVSSFARKMRDVAPRPKTPELDDEDAAGPELGSPSAGRNSVVRPRGVKRRSGGELPNHSPKASRASHSSRGTSYVTSSPSPLYPQIDDSSSSFQTAPVVSFNSTIPGLDGAMDYGHNVSFQTDYTEYTEADMLPDARPAQTEFNCSLPSMPSSVLRTLDQPRIPDVVPDTTSAFGSRLQRVKRWRDEVKPAADVFSSANSRYSFTKSSTSSETREALFRLQDPTSRTSYNVHQSPSQALSQMQIQDTTPSPVVAQAPVSMEPIDACIQIMDLPQSGMFFSDVTGSNLEYRTLWECQRWSLVTGLPFERFLSHVPQHTDDYAAFFEALRSATLGSNNIMVPHRCSQQVWQFAKYDDHRSRSQQEPVTPNQETIPERGVWDVQYKARLAFSDSKDAPHLFRTTLLPMSSDKSCRFQRRYGAHRVLYVDVPDLGRLPTELFNGHSHLQDMFLEWLCTTKHFLGRAWHAVHLEQSKAKKTDSERFGGYRVVLLALSGDGLLPLNLATVFQDFMQLHNEDNMGRHFRKLWSRIDLGFSKTISSITFKPSQVILIDDIYADDTPESELFRDPTCDWTQQAHLASNEGHNMTDGCSNISVAAMKAIWSKIGGVDALPAAVQGRIGGAKGVWVRSGPADSTEERDLDIWIEIRESQLKFDFPEDTTDDSFDAIQWTFEVSSITESRSHETLGGHLHMDMVPLVIDRHVSLSNIVEVVTQGLVGPDEVISEIFRDPLQTRQWVAVRDTTRENGKPGPDSGAGSRVPISSSGKLVYYLEHGFDPMRTPYLIEQGRAVAKEYFSKAVQKFKVKLQCSVSLMGIADPYGVLEPDTIHVGFSRNFYDPSKQAYIHHLHNVPGIITRFPMQLPSDIQKIKIVYDERLQHLPDCIIFPTRGPVSLPSKLQGGDLDGDRFVLIWDERLVASFKNAPVMPAKRPLDYFGVVKDNRKLRDVYFGQSPILNFLKEGFRARLQRVPLGLTSNFLGRLAYKLGEHAYKTSAILKLAELYTLLIDADKQGHNFDERGFADYIEREPDISQWLKIPGKPAYAKAIEKGVETKMGRDDFAPRHPIDIILFKHVLPSIQQVFKQFDDLHESCKFASDDDLKAPCELARTHSDPAMCKENMLVADKLQTLRRGWRRDFRQNNDKNNVPDIIEKYLTDYGDIEPQVESLAQQLEHKRLRNEPSTHELHKASVLYSIVPAGESQNISFQLAGSELAYIKSQSVPGVGRRLIREDIYALMKIKKRKLEQVFDLSSGDQNEDDDGAEDVVDSSEGIDEPIPVGLHNGSDDFQDAVEEMDGITSSEYF